MAALAAVTGASSGIGLAYAEALAARGYDLVVVGRREDRLRDLADRVHGSHSVDVKCVAADLATADGLEALLTELSGREVDLLVNNAGIAHYKRFVDLSRDELHELLTVNINVLVALEYAVLPAMIGRGSGTIINISSMTTFSAAATRPDLPRRAVYAATKSFVSTHTRILSAELEDTGVLVQLVIPGVVATEFHSRQGIDLSFMPRMTPDVFVAAALADLDAGVLMSVPAAPDIERLAEIDAAHVALFDYSTSVTPAERYAALSPADDGYSE